MAKRPSVKEILEAARRGGPAKPAEETSERLRRMLRPRRWRKSQLRLKAPGGPGCGGPGGSRRKRPDAVVAGPAADAQREAGGGPCRRGGPAGAAAPAPRPRRLPRRPPGSRG